jgi:transposase
MQIQTLSRIEEIEKWTSKRGQYRWKWNSSKRRAAMMLALGFSRRAVARTVEVSRRSIASWLGRPEFCARVDYLQWFGPGSDRIRAALVEQEQHEETIEPMPQDTEALFAEASRLLASVRTMRRSCQQPRSRDRAEKCVEAPKVLLQQ